MLIWDWNSTDVAMWSLLAKNQVYRCSIDGHQKFQGETLPDGTEEYVLDWIKARYKVVGELLLIDMDTPRFNIIFHTCADLESTMLAPVVKRYLIEVNGVEKVLKLTPHPLQRPYGLLTWQTTEENSSAERVRK